MRSLRWNRLGAEGAAALAPALAANGGLTELSIYGNRVGYEGVSAICEAIQSNKETKLASLNFGYNGIGPVGANALAAMVAATGSLTSLNLAQNRVWCCFFPKVVLFFPIRIFVHSCASVCIPMHFIVF